jgi:hypothetical protein
MHMLQLVACKGGHLSGGSVIRGTAELQVERWTRYKECYVYCCFAQVMRSRGVSIMPGNDRAP